MKKVLSVIVSAALLLALIVPTTALAETTFTATCQSVTANAGDSISIDVVLTYNPGFNALQLTPSYNSEVMTLNAPTNGELIGDFLPGDNYNWINGFSDTYDDGLLVTLNFDISDAAPSGAYEVGFSYVQCISVDNGVKEIPLKVVPATVTVSGTAPQEIIVGDLDNDGVVTDADAVYLLMYTFFPEDYPINQGCDFDGDGDVTDADAVYLLMYTFFPDDYPIEPSTPPQPPIEPGDPGETEPDPFED